jgi:hypothetical protein
MIGLNRHSIAKGASDLPEVTGAVERVDGSVSELACPVWVCQPGQFRFG